jgi:hypothetical protein
MTTAQTCGECGARTEPGLSFCDACGAVLSWPDRARSPRPTGTSASAGTTARGTSATPTGTAVSRQPPARGTTATASTGTGAPRQPGARVTDATAPTRADATRGAIARTSGASPTSADASLETTARGTTAAPAGTTPYEPPAEPARDTFSRPGGRTGLPRAAVPARAAPPTAARSAAPPPDLRPVAAPFPAPAPDPYQDPYLNPGPDADADLFPDPYLPADAHPDPYLVGGAEPATLELPARPGHEDGYDDGYADGSAAGEDPDERARRLLVPVADPGPGPEPGVAPVLPGRPAAARPRTVRAPGGEPGAEGGTPCHWCAVPNRPDRHFCARCAMPLAAGADERPPGPPPWWRRLPGLRGAEVPWAGDRPRVRRPLDRLLSWAGAAVALTLAIVLAVHVPQAVRATRDHFATRAPVAPDHVSASRSYPGHRPGLAFDEYSNTWWGPGVSESGQGQWIQAAFDRPADLLDVVVTPGVSAQPGQSSRSALPHRLDVTVTRADGTTSTSVLDLDEGAGGQRRSFRHTGVVAVRFTLDSAYQPSRTKQVAIAEIEFFGPSHADGG